MTRISDGLGFSRIKFRPITPHTVCKPTLLCGCWYLCPTSRFQTQEDRTVSVSLARCLEDGQCLGIRHQTKQYIVFTYKRPALRYVTRVLASSQSRALKCTSLLPVWLSPPLQFTSTLHPLSEDIKRRCGLKSLDPVRWVP